MKSDIDGKITLEAEITQIDRRGIWLLVGKKESFLSFEDSLASGVLGYPRFIM